ncbi:MAG: PRC-barrel domain-containing protein [Candidatus Rokuibacteriota bacterium]
MRHTLRKFLGRVSLSLAGPRTGKGLALLALMGAIVLPGGWASAQVAGSRRPAAAVAPGLSAIKEMIGQPVYNERNQRVGRIDDLIIKRASISHAIVGAGKLVGLGKRNVAIPLSQLKHRDGKFVLPGATEETMKALPRFEYAQAGGGKAEGRELAPGAPGVRDDPPLFGLLLLLTGQTRKR